MSKAKMFLAALLLWGSVIVACVPLCAHDNGLAAEPQTGHAQSARSVMVSQADQYDWSRFEVTFTITYNVMTLAEAADKEAEVRKAYSDACTIKVDAKRILTPTTASWDSLVIGAGGTTTPALIYNRDNNTLEYRLH